jgi:DNA repair protein RecN (Recombination protein N)
VLVRLSIRDIVLIDRLDLDVGGGLTVLTGETGAGKSILLDAFSLSLGARGDGSLVREGQAQGQVTAVFELPQAHPVHRIAQAQDLRIDGELVLRRVQMADGRTRAFVNDQPTSAQALRTIARALVEIHGQHDDRALIDPSSHRALLDSFGALEPLLVRTRQAFDGWKGAERHYAEEEARLAATRREADYLRHAHAELSKLAPQSHEEGRLAQQRADMMQGEKVATELRDAHESVTGDAAPIGAIAGALRRLERRVAQAPGLIEPSVRALGEALEALAAVQSALEEALQKAAFDPRELERVEERLFALRGAARKYQVSVEALPQLKDRIGAELAGLDASEARLAQLTAAVAEGRADYAVAAAELARARRRAGRELDAVVNAELAPLKLENARFVSELSQDVAAREGTDRVEFWVETNPGTRPGPLLKVASGGELARFMLALKVALADRGSAPTLVFDEIDTGVGGAVADAIGQRLARLAENVQVLAVTHAPQVAARAGAHLRIAKDRIGGSRRVATRVASLEQDARREEIARMLAGATITEEARAAAARLIEAAR